ncbi:OLC1v1000414C1 [Oldenlandia corymbosa var. corymbosa]|uniref:OLC1v1000414C1 n=1 Tax=Oldenlandia corymbosa var. corymbosa TaxID=529605 RepID=A0AAV1D3M2_OLDCO|nr:OLC1v1000414C1 [Oldenlandia corymbosa var. corymbosa]
MACAVPLTFYGFSVPRTTSVQEAHERQLAGSRPSAMVMRSMNPSGPKYSDRVVLTVTGHCFSTKALSRTNHHQPTVFQFSGRFTTHVVMTGIWVGPDNEDGWGFVQAFVHQT